MTQTIKSIQLGTRRCFVGDMEIKKPVNHGHSIAVFNTLVEQAGFTIKEWNGTEWVDLHTTNLKILKRHGS